MWVLEFGIFTGQFFSEDANGIALTVNGKCYKQTFLDILSSELENIDAGWKC